MADDWIRTNIRRFQAKYPSPAHQARPRTVTPPRDQGSGWTRDLNPRRSVSETDSIPKYQPDSHRGGIFSCAINGLCREFCDALRIVSCLLWLCRLRQVLGM